MTAGAAPVPGGPRTLTIAGRAYPVLLPKLADPRLHLAATITSLQVIGQIGFHFRLSIAQILISLATCAVLEVCIAAWRQQVLLWPASAMLTGNGVAFVLRVPGTRHGDWWSTRGWWIFAAVSAASLLSKHVLALRGNHVFNPSNIGLVLCFLVLSSSRAEPLDFWWGPMSAWLVLALVVIVAGGFAILSRLKLLRVALSFWASFAAGLAVLTATGHQITARWHLGPIGGVDFWWLLVTSPEVLVFLFFMITDPKTAPRGPRARIVYGASLGLLAVLLFAPLHTEYWSKVALLGSLAIVCVAQSAYALLPRRLPRPSRRALAGAGALGLAAYAGTLVALNPTPGATAAAPPLVSAAELPTIEIGHSAGVSTQLTQTAAKQIASDLLADLDLQARALRTRRTAVAAPGVGGTAFASLVTSLGHAAGKPVTVPSYRVDRLRLVVEPGQDQGPPTVVARATGTVRRAVYGGAATTALRRYRPTRFATTFDLVQSGARFMLVSTSTSGAGAAAAPQATAPPAPLLETSAGGVRLRDVASQVGLDFRQDSFHFGMSAENQAMMGGGVCWLDYNGDGWVDLFAVNSYSSADTAQWEAHGGLPTTALFENVHGRFRNVSRRAHADLQVQGDGCAAADLNGDGRPDLIVTTTTGIKLLWNNGNGTFTEGARAAGLTASGWFTGVAVADVNGDGRPDIFVAGYTDPYVPVPSSTAGFPTADAGVRDLLYLNEGNDSHGHARFREVGVQAGLEDVDPRHGLGATFVDYNGDGRPDLYVANDEDPNQLYENVPWPGGVQADPEHLGFRFEERGAVEGVADPFAGMGIAAGGYTPTGRSSLFVTNSRHEPSAAYSNTGTAGAPAFANARPDFAAALGSDFAGWGDAWVDLANSGTPDLVLTAGAIPVTSLATDAEPVRVLAPTGKDGRYADARGIFGAKGLNLNGRGLAAADVDNNGRMDIAINTIGGRLVLLRPSGPSGHWLDVRLARFSPGAVVTVELPGGHRLSQAVQAGSSYLSSADPRLHFGLGSSAVVERLTVRYPWSDGVTTLSDVRADRIVTVPAPHLRAARTPAPRAALLAGCEPRMDGAASVARLWNETATAVLRAGSASDPVAARDLFDASAAVWDAWAAYDPRADGYFVSAKAQAPDVQRARETAISFAAYRVLLWEASFDSNLDRAFTLLTGRLRSLCDSPDYTSTAGGSPAAVGNRIAAAAIAAGLHDGSLQLQHYLDPSYTPENAPLVLPQNVSTVRDPTFWQPLAFRQIAVHGLGGVPAAVQTFVGSQWGHVRPFALAPSPRGLPLDPGAPLLGDPSGTAYKRAAVAVIRATSKPGRRPAADTTPLAWAALASSLPADGGAAARLRSDVELDFALGGALNDAAIAAWGAKRAYQAPRPVSMIRYLGFEGQSSDPKAASYSVDGLPLVPGLIELVTPASVAPGRPLAVLAKAVGQVAVLSGGRWVRAAAWTPPGATPASPGWIAEGSTFASAADEVLTALTGRSYAARAAAAERAGVVSGIDIPADVTAGRAVGAAVGRKATVLARRYFAGSASR